MQPKTLGQVSRFTPSIKTKSASGATGLICTHRPDADFSQEKLSQFFCQLKELSMKDPSW
jgi:hypothetical protein